MSSGIYLTHLLTRYGVEHVFGIPGVHTLELYRALAAAKIRHITPRHEQGAGFMADGYARVSGRPGVCFIISGPGMTNIATAMGQAFADSIPMLVISTVNSHGHMGSGDGWLHELPDQQALIKGVCAFSHTIHDAAEIHSVLARSFAVFTGARPRPVHIEVPINVLLSAAPQVPLPDKVITTARPSGNAAKLREAAELINKSTMPLILAGGGAISAADEVERLAQKIDAPVVMTINARGILGTEHPLAVGASPSLDSVRTLINDADVVLALGTELGSTDYDMNEDGQFGIPGQLIRIDIDPQQLMRTRIPEIAITGDTAESLRVLDTYIEQIARTATGRQRAAECLQSAFDSMPPRYQQYVSVLNTVRDTLPESPIVGDSMQFTYAGNTAFNTHRPSSYFNSATGFGTLGYGLPAAIGAAIAQPGKTIISLIGDGGLQFSLAELTTAVDADVNLILIVHENGGYAEIRHYMEAVKIDPVGVDLLVPDIKMLAQACHWNAWQVESLDNFPALLKRADSADKPTLLLMNDKLFEQS